MSTIRIKFRDGSVREFKHEGRPGGSYTKTLRYKEGWAVVEDEYGKETAFPADVVAEVETWPTRW